MLLARSLYLCGKRSEQKFKWTYSWNPARYWRLRSDYPDSWRWLVLAERIQGFLSHAEGDRLFRLARDLSPSENPVLVEIGSWKGKSSVMLAAGLAGKKNAKVYCIDSFAGDENPIYQERYYKPLLEQHPCDLEKVFRTNISCCGLEHVATPCKGFSFEWCARWKLPIDVLFIDANHEYDAVLRDFDNWSPFVKIGGAIAFHDVGDQYEGPRHVVSQRLKPPAFGPVSIVNTLAWAIKCGVAVDVDTALQNASAHV